MDAKVVEFTKRLRMVIEGNVIEGMREIYNDMLCHQARLIGVSRIPMFNTLIGCVGAYLEQIDELEELKKDMIQRLEGDNGFLDS